MNTLDTQISLMVQARREWSGLSDSTREYLCLAYCAQHSVSLSDVLHPSDDSTVYRLAAKRSWDGAESGSDSAATRLHQLVRDRALEYAERTVRTLYLEAWEAEEAERARYLAELNR